MGAELTVAFIPGDVDLTAGLAALDALDDRVLLDRAHLGLLRWEWELPGGAGPDDAGEQGSGPAAHDDPELVQAEQADEIPEELAARYVAAARGRLAVSLRSAAVLLSGQHRWFESRVAQRLPLAGGGEMVVFAEGDLGSDETVLSDIARLPVDVLPEVGRVMGVLGPAAVSIHVTVEDEG